MLRNYIILLRRKLSRQPIHFFLTLSCLSLGIAAAIVVLLYLDFELNYDRSYTHADRVFRIDTKSIQTQSKTIEVDWSSTPANLGAYLQQDYAEIENWTRLFRFWQNDEIKFEYQESTYEEDQVYAADASVIDIFSLNFLTGNPDKALEEPNKIVISERLAKRIFGDSDPLGKIITSKIVHNLPDTEDDYTFEITGVYQNIPRNSHLVAEALISSKTDVHEADYYFSNFNVSTYILLTPKADVHALTEKLPQIYEKYLNKDREPVLVSANHELTHVTKIHLKETGGYTYIYIFSGIGMLLLLIAGVSYVNLTTAQAGQRAVEIGVRKVMGSHKKQLIAQFLTESVFFTFLSLVAAVGLVIVSVNLLNKNLGLQVEINQLMQPYLLLGLVVIILLLGIVGGSYPAFFLSSFEPIAVMKGKGSKKAPFRSFLIAIQFAVAIFVLVCTGMIYQQLQFIRQKDLGFNQQHTVMLNLTGENTLQRQEVLKNSLLQNPAISGVTAANFIPGTGGMINGPVSADEGVDQEPKFVRRGAIDYDFLATMNIDLLAGRNFSPEFPADGTLHVLVNEAFVEVFGLKNPVGSKIRLGDKGNPNHLNIIGVVKNFHQGSLHEAIEPQLFQLKPGTWMAIKVENDLQEGIRQIEKSWVKLFPDASFQYRFLDDALQESYQSDQVRGKVFLLLSVVLVFITFLSLFGLASFLAKQRIKEVGIRKVLGATSTEIVFLLTKKYLFLVIAAALPASYIAWLVINQWLENFAFRVDINYLLFSFVLVGTLLITFVTTGLHAIRAAGLNPAKTLKSE